MTKELFVSDRRALAEAPAGSRSWRARVASAWLEGLAEASRGGAAAARARSSVSTGLVPAWLPDRPVADCRVAFTAASWRLAEARVAASTAPARSGHSLGIS